MWDEKVTLHKSFIGFCKSVLFHARFRFVSYSRNIYVDKSYEVGLASIIDKKTYAVMLHLRSITYKVY